MKKTARYKSSNSSPDRLINVAGMHSRIHARHFRCTVSNPYQCARYTLLSKIKYDDLKFREVTCLARVIQIVSDQKPTPFTSVFLSFLDIKMCVRIILNASKVMNGY